MAARLDPPPVRFIPMEKAADTHCKIFWLGPIARLEVLEKIWNPCWNVVLYTALNKTHTYSESVLDS